MFPNRVLSYVQGYHAFTLFTQRAVEVRAFCQSSAGAGPVLNTALDNRKFCPHSPIKSQTSQLSRIPSWLITVHVDTVRVGANQFTVKDSNPPHAPS